MTTKSLTHAGCVVFRDDEEKIQYLIATSSTGEHWILPQGHIDPGETPEVAALRELEEETGVVGEIIRPLSIQEFDKGNEKVVVQYYLVRMIRDENANGKSRNSLGRQRVCVGIAFIRRSQKHPKRCIYKFKIKHPAVAYQV